jgi:hypothetical protein
MNTVTERALVGRINRRLAREGWQLHKSRPGEIADFGRYHITDSNVIIDSHVEPLRWAWQMCLLGNDETLEMTATACARRAPDR